MALFAQRVLLVILSLLLITPVVNAGAPTTTDSCLYPSMHERFGITVGGPIQNYDVDPLSAAGYLNWSANLNPAHPNGMDYYPVIYVNDTNDSWTPYGYYPNGIRLERRVRNNPGATWLVGSEADYRWHNDHASPEGYARIYHDVYQIIKGIDPSAKVAANSLATVSTLRLAWLDRVWQTYQALYGQEMPVDVWTLHSYTVNEMVYEWGPDIPPGFDNVVGYGTGAWSEVRDPAASGGSYHLGSTAGARAYFAFAGPEATLYLRSGPDYGIVSIYRDKQFVEQVDLYAATPGQIDLSYSGLPASQDPMLGDRHHLRVQVTGQKNTASGGISAAVDALEAPSTGDLAGGRLEDDSPLQARVLFSIDQQDDLDVISEQVRMMRQWMADHGQRHKPLINTEYGILMGEELGFDYERVRDFMLGSFDLFVSDQGLVDSEIGMPEDGERLLQQWFWFILAADYFNSSRVHTGLYDPVTHEIRPLGEVYGEYVADLVSNYTDLQASYLQVDPVWPLFAGGASLIHIQGSVQNHGNSPAGPFWVRLSDGGATLNQWYVADGLSADNDGNDFYDIETTWTPVITADHLLTLTADSTGLVDEPCDPNNSISETLGIVPETDLALDDLQMTPRYPDSRAARLSLAVSLANRGSLGATADQLIVSFWDGDPDNGGELLYSETILPDANPRQATVSFDWQTFQSGQHEIIAQVEAAPGETNLANNRISLSFSLPDGDYLRHFPLYVRGSDTGSGSTQTKILPPLLSKQHYRLP